MPHQQLKSTIQKSLIILTLLISNQTLAHNKSEQIFANEKAIIFTTMDNKTVNAFEGYILSLIHI